MEEVSDLQVNAYLRSRSCPIGLGRAYQDLPLGPPAPCQLHEALVLRSERE